LNLPLRKNKMDSDLDALFELAAWIIMTVAGICATFFLIALVLEVYNLADFGILTCG